MSRTSLAVALAVAWLSAPLAAQSGVRVGELQPGAKVRVVAPGIVAGRYTGTVLTRTDDTLTLGGPNSVPFAVPTSRITSLEISRGKSRSDGAVLGMKWGVPIGLVLGILSIGFTDDCVGCARREDNFGTRAADIAGGVAGGVLWGAGIGALIGRERWDAFELPRHAALGIRPGGASLALRYEFR